MAPAETLTVPTQRHGVSMRASPSSNTPKKSWQSRVPFANSKARRSQSEDQMGRPTTHQSTRSVGAKNDAWWKTKLFSGMINDIQRRAPFYMSDWKDAWDYRVVPATVYMYFAKYVPTLSSNFRLEISCPAVIPNNQSQQPYHPLIYLSRSDQIDSVLRTPD
jgi:hypothetical protein